MFLHVGNQKNIREKFIIGIFDMDNATVSSVTRRFLATAQKQSRVGAAKEEIPKSFVLYLEDPADNNSFRVCMSPLSSAALAGRVGRDGFENIDLSEDSADAADAAVADKSDATGTETAETVADNP